MTESSRPEFWTTRYRTGATPWDLGRPPAALLDWLARTPGGGRVLIPGVGSGHEIPEFIRTGWIVSAIDLSEAAIDLARSRIGSDAGPATLLHADFFATPLEFRSFDAVYERTFLCAVHPARWRRLADRLAALLRPGGVLVGHFYFGDKAGGPPFGLAPGEAADLFDRRFELLEDAPATDSLSLFAGGERWQVRRRRD